MINYSLHGFWTFVSRLVFLCPFASVFFVILSFDSIFKKGIIQIEILLFARLPVTCVSTQKGVEK